MGFKCLCLFAVLLLSGLSGPVKAQESPLKDEVNIDSLFDAFNLGSTEEREALMSLFLKWAQSKPREAEISYVLGLQYLKIGSDYPYGSPKSMEHGDSALSWFRKARNQYSLYEGYYGQSIKYRLQQAYFHQGMNLLRNERFSDFKALIKKSYESLTPADIGLAKNTLRQCNDSAILILNGALYNVEAVKFWYIQIAQKFRQDVAVLIMDQVGQPWMQLLLNRGVRGIFPRVHFSQITPILIDSDATVADISEPADSNIIITLTSRAKARLRRLTDTPPPTSASIPISKSISVRYVTSDYYELCIPVLLNILASTLWQKPVYVTGHTTFDFNNYLLRDEGYVSEVLPWRKIDTDSQTRDLLTKDRDSYRKIFSTRGEFSNWGHTYATTPSLSVPFRLALNYYRYFEPSISENKTIFKLVWALPHPISSDEPYFGMAIYAHDTLGEDVTSYLTGMKNELRDILLNVSPDLGAVSYHDQVALPKYFKVSKALQQCEEAKRTIQQLRVELEKKGGKFSEIFKLDREDQLFDCN